jgi:hypothetical protein
MRSGVSVASTLTGYILGAILVVAFIVSAVQAIRLAD